MSCSLGALAMVYGWGYDYNGTPEEQYRFDSGIHAKRASYCGDSQFHTISGVVIDLADDARIAQPELYIDAPGREAVWTPRGAFCVDPLHMRNYDIPGMPRFEPPYRCSVMGDLLDCVTAVPPDPYVVSGEHYDVGVKPQP
jgi:ADYC domain